jgi:hypothetical protein
MPTPTSQPEYLVIPLASIPLLSADEVTGPNADVRKVFYAIAEAMYDSYRSKFPDQLPARMALQRQTDSRVNQIDRDYLFRFQTFINANEVVDENR